jgi:hypothetical protein
MSWPAPTNYTTSLVRVACDCRCPHDTGLGKMSDLDEAPSTDVTRKEWFWSSKPLQEDFLLATSVPRASSKSSISFGLILGAYVTSQSRLATLPPWWVEVL